MSRLTEKLKNGNYICGIIKGGFVDKLGHLEDIEEIIENMYDRKTYICSKIKDGQIVKDNYCNDFIGYSFKDDAIEVYGYGFLAEYKMTECGDTWWLEDKEE